MKKIVGIILFISLLLIGGCTQISKQVECTKDSDCSIGGCSGQICAPTDKAGQIVTTCEYKAEYGCYKLTNCGCVEDKCNWRENKEFNQCMTEN